MYLCLIQDVYYVSRVLKTIINHLIKKTPYKETMTSLLNIEN